MQYEGISSLCFSCGHMGHRKEGCPYAIKEPMADRRMVAEGAPVDESKVEAKGSKSQEAGNFD